jgi:predicted nucleic acid-binding protein
VTGVVVDASVLIACAISDGKARRTFFSASGIEFYAPEFVQEELLKRTPRILALSGVPPPVLSALWDDLFARLTIVPRAAFSHRLKQATQLTEKADARGDEDYVALALALDAPVWTYDKDFARVREIRVVSREQIASGLTD